MNQDRTSQPIVVATGNPHKLEELAAIFSPRGLAIEGLADQPDAPFPEPEETADTFTANATIKAAAYARMTGKPCLADDSGLEVDALGGAPGVISSHYATDGAESGMPRAMRDLANNARLLRELELAPDDQRTARFVCVMVLATPDGTVLHETRGTMEGRIGRRPAGSNGFGYDPLFLVAPAFARTSAELEPAEKNAISHRAGAATAMADWLNAQTA